MIRPRLDQILLRPAGGVISGPVRSARHAFAATALFLWGCSDPLQPPSLKPEQVTTSRISPAGAEFEAVLEGQAIDSLPLKTVGDLAKAAKSKE